MSLEELASLMEEALKEKEKPRPQRKRAVRPRPKIPTVESTVEKTVERIIKKKIDTIVNIVVERALEQLPSILTMRTTKRTTNKIPVTEEDIEAIMPHLREFSYSKKKKRHWGPRRFVPVEFYEYLKAKGVDITLEKLRAILRELLRGGVLRKTSEARYQLVVEGGGG